MLRKVNREIARVEARLQAMAMGLGVSSWSELERLFTGKGVDSPEIDLLLPEYLYLKERLQRLKERKKAAFKALED